MSFVAAAVPAELTTSAHRPAVRGHGHQATDVRSLGAVRGASGPADVAAETAALAARRRGPRCRVDQRQGSGVANALVAAMIIGAIPGILFFAVVGALAAPGELAASYATATLVSVVSSGIITHASRPRIPVRATLHAEEDSTAPHAT